MKTILVPTDFSKPAQQAVTLGTAIAKKSKATLVLLHVVEQPSSAAVNVAGEVVYVHDWADRIFTLKLIDKSKQQLLQQEEKCRAEGVKIRSELRIGTPFKGVQEIVTAQAVDLIVMGTEGRSKLEEILIGSTTEKVIRQANCPVLTVGRKTNVASFSKIVYATSLIKDEEKFALEVQKFQRLYDAELHLVWINTPGMFQPDTQVRNTLAQFAKRMKLRNVQISTFSDYSVEEGILHYAESIEADLIAMATHGRTGFAHVLAGSIAEDVAKNAPRPVLTYVMK